MSYYSPLNPWLNGGPYFLKSLFYIREEEDHIERTWIAFDHVIPLHKSPKLRLVPFDVSFDEFNQYVTKACSILGRTNPGWTLTSDERSRVIANLGAPPIHSYSIYMMTVSDAKSPQSERVVYIGKTNARSHRFRQGHAAITKLHAPKYKKTIKRLYLVSVSIENHDGHIFPAEWMPEDQRNNTLDYVEAQLIANLQPALNKVGRNNTCVDFDQELVVHNYTRTKFLDATAM